MYYKNSEDVDDGFEMFPYCREYILLGPIDSDAKLWIYKYTTGGKRMKGTRNKDMTKR